MCLLFNYFCNCFKFENENCKLMNILLNKGNRLIEKDLNLLKILKTLKSLKVIMN